MPWIKISLSGDQVKEGELKAFLQKCRDAFHEAGLPTDMALFAGRPEADNVHPFYLSPACSKLAENLMSGYAGAPCEKPRKGGLEPTLVIGFNKAWDLLLE
ncbi:hypothetical protein ACFL0H_01615 [Thermodesulfobacteriota bacterium]